MTLNTIIEEEKKGAKESILETFEDGTIRYCPRDLETKITTAVQRAYEAGYKLAVEHLKEAYTHNATTTVPEAIEWLEDNSKYQDKK